MANKQKQLAAPKEETKLTMEMFNNDPQLLLFFEEWISNGMNATEAYRKFHPDVTYASAGVLGSRELGKVRKDIVLKAYGLDAHRYFKQLGEGLSAKKGGILRKYDKQGNIIEEIDLTQPDHKVRLPYHDKLGIHLDLEKEQGTGSPIVPIQNNIYNLNDAELKRITS